MMWFFGYSLYVIYSFSPRTKDHSFITLDCASFILWNVDHKYFDQMNIPDYESDAFEFERMVLGPKE